MDECGSRYTKSAQIATKNNERKYMCDQEIQRALPVITMKGP